MCRHFAEEDQERLTFAKHSRFCEAPNHSGSFDAKLGVRAGFSSPLKALLTTILEIVRIVYSILSPLMLHWQVSCDELNLYFLGFCRAQIWKSWQRRVLSSIRSQRLSFFGIFPEMGATTP